MRSMGSQAPYVEMLFVQPAFPNPSRIGFLNKQRPFLLFTSPRRDYLCLGLVFLRVKSKNNMMFPASLNTVGALREES